MVGWLLIGVGDFQDLYPHPDEGEVQNEEHDITDIHTRDNAPENISVLFEKQGTCLDTLGEEES